MTDFVAIPLHPEWYDWIGIEIFNIAPTAQTAVLRVVNHDQEVWQEETLEIAPYSNSQGIVEDFVGPVPKHSTLVVWTKCGVFCLQAKDNQQHITIKQPDGDIS